VDVKGLEKLLQNPKIGEGLTESQIKQLKEGIKAHYANPALEKAREYQEQKYQCKECFGYKFSFDPNNEEYKKLFLESFNSLRKSPEYGAACFGCRGLSARSIGCSMMRCKTEMCTNNICIYCLNGASQDKTLKHDFSTCTEKVRDGVEPPLPRLCECEHDNTHPTS
jgi:hypothetical protein